jgi:hypothetical protein
MTTPNAAPSAPATPAAGAAPAAAPAEGTPAAAPAATPAAAPVAPAVGDAPAAEAPKLGSDEAGSFAPTGDAGLDYALGFIGKLGFGGDHPAVQAAENGDFGLLKAHLAQLGDKAQGWEQIIALGEQGLGRITEGAKAKAAAAQADVIKAVGGEEQWGKIKEWAGANAEPAEKEAINTALAQGGLVTRAVATYLNGLFERATGVTVEPANAAPGAGNAGAPSSGALSPRAYVKEVEALRAKLGGRMDGSAEYAALQARRNAWRG